MANSLNVVFPPVVHSPFTDVREMLLFLVDAGDIEDSDVSLDTINVARAALRSQHSPSTDDIDALADVCSLGLEYLVNINDEQDTDAAWTIATFGGLPSVASPLSVREYLEALS